MASRHAATVHVLLALVVLFVLLGSVPVGALAADADPARGRPMVDKDCNGCHVRQFGSVERIYVRDDRRVRTPAQLQAQVAYCNTQLGAGYFPDDEAHIAAWLDQQYYRFGR